MPEKDIGFWINLYNIAREQGIALAMVFVLTIFRMYRDEKHPSFKLVLYDSAFGSLIVFSVGVTCREFGLSYGWMDGWMDIGYFWIYWRIWFGNS